MQDLAQRGSRFSSFLMVNTCILGMAQSAPFSQRAHFFLGWFWGMSQDSQCHAFLHNNFVARLHDQDENQQVLLSVLEGNLDASLQHWHRKPQDQTLRAVEKWGSRESCGKHVLEPECPLQTCQPRWKVGWKGWCPNPLCACWRVIWTGTGRHHQVCQGKFCDIGPHVCRQFSNSRLHIPAGILRIPAFSVPVALFSQESRFLFRHNFFRTSSGNLSVWGLLYVWPQFTIWSLEIKCFASLPLRLLTGRSKNKKSHLWHGMMIGIFWDILGGRLLRDYLGLIHVLRNLDLKLLIVSCACWSGVRRKHKVLKASTLKFT